MGSKIKQIKAEEWWKTATTAMRRHVLQETGIHKTSMSRLMVSKNLTTTHARAGAIRGAMEELTPHLVYMST